MEDKNRAVREQQLRAAINAKLIETGERERLKELLQQKLIECGWRDQVKSYCKGNFEIISGFLSLTFPQIDVVKAKGLDNITVEDLVLEMVPKGRALVPDSVKKELLQRIRNFLAAQNELF